MRLGRLWDWGLGFDRQASASRLALLDFNMIPVAYGVRLLPGVLIAVGSVIYMLRLPPVW
jgi:hypothetical protein